MIFLTAMIRTKNICYEFIINKLTQLRTNVKSDQDYY